MQVTALVQGQPCMHSTRCKLDCLSDLTTEEMKYIQDMGIHYNNTLANGTCCSRNEEGIPPLVQLHVRESYHPLFPRGSASRWHQPGCLSSGNNDLHSICNKFYSVSNYHALNIQWVWLMLFSNYFLREASNSTIELLHYQGEKRLRVDSKHCMTKPTQDRTSTLTGILVHLVV